ncbi:MAG TPA: hypothetical protein VF897_02985 [Roseiflexaceae bacterium]
MRTRVMARLGLALLAVLALAQAPRAKAANPIVTSCGDDTQLDQALLVGGTITFNCGPGNYTIPISSTKTIPTGAAIKIDGGSRYLPLTWR